MKNITLVLISLIVSIQVYSQCVGFPETIAEDDCSNYAPLTSGENLNAGTTRGICPLDSSIQYYNNINLNGGTIRICGNASITGNFNAGNIVVQCGASLYLPAGMLLNQNMKVVNYGNVYVTGNLDMQNENVAFFNESPSSRLIVDGSINFAANTNQDGYLKNNGYIMISNTLDLLDGGFVCLGDSSIIDTRNFRFGVNCGGPNNRMYYSGTGTIADVYVENTSTLRGFVTSSPLIRFSLGPNNSITTSNCGTFGLALVSQEAVQPSDPGPSTVGCFDNCYTVLPVEMIDFYAVESDGGIQLNWSTASETNNDYFEIYRSEDGFNWSVIGTKNGNGTTTSISYYRFIDENPNRGQNYYHIEQVDFDGQRTSTNTISVEFSAESVEVYPNPSYVGKEISIVGISDIEEVTIFDATGRKINAEISGSGANNLTISIAQIGYYTIQAITKDGEIYRKQILIK